MQLEIYLSFVYTVQKNHINDEIKLFSIYEKS